jgi:DNA modification methylase
MGVNAKGLREKERFIDEALAGLQLNGVQPWTFEQLEKLKLADHAERQREEELSLTIPTTPFSKTGDLWLLGGHRLLCGDSTNPNDIAKLMNGEKAVLMATDPPYGVSFKGQKYNPRAKAWDGILGDTKQGDDLEEWLTHCIKQWFPHITKDAAFYFWADCMEPGFSSQAIKAAGLHVQSQIIWCKNCMVLGQSDYQWRHENAWYAFWKGEQHRWFGGRDKTSVWEVSKVSNAAYVHPMQKPIELFINPIQYHTHIGEIVLEPFSGSGSQFIAAEQLKRWCYGMEMDPVYVDVIVQRWSNYTGLDPIRKSDGASWRELNARRATIGVSG